MPITFLKAHLPSSPAIKSSPMQLERVRCLLLGLSKEIQPNLNVAIRKEILPVSRVSHHLVLFLLSFGGCGANIESKPIFFKGPTGNPEAFGDSGGPQSIILVSRGGANRGQDNLQLFYGERNANSRPLKAQLRARLPPDSQATRANPWPFQPKRQGRRS